MSLKSERGLSLIETVIALTVLALALAAIFAMTGFIAREWVFARGQTDVQQHLRVLLDRVTRDIRRSTDGRLKDITTTPDIECPMATSGTTCLLLDSATVVNDDAGTKLNPPQEVCLEDVEGLVAGATLTLVGPGKIETVTISCVDTGCSGSPPNGPPAVCTGSGKKVRFTTQLVNPRQRGEIVTPLPVSIGYDATAKRVYRNGIPLAEYVVPIAPATSAPSYDFTETTLSAPAAVGNSAISVTSAAGLAQFDVIGIGRYDGTAACAPPAETIKEVKELRIIMSISGTTLNLDTPLAACHASGRAVRTQVISVQAAASRTAEGTQGEVIQTARLAARARLRN